MPGLAQQLILDAIRRKRYKKLAALLAEDQPQPAAGKSVSELAKVLGGVGQAMPIPEHMGNNALPFSDTPTLRPDQMRQMQPPSAINAQNAQAKKIRDLISSGTPEGVELGISMAMPQAGGKPSINSVSGGYTVSYPDGRVEYIRTEEKDPVWGTYIGKDGKEYTAPKSQIYQSGLPTGAGPQKPMQWTRESAGKNEKGEELERQVLTIADPETGEMRTFRSDVTSTKASGTQVTVNTGDLTKGVQGDLQTEIYKNVASMARLTQVRGEWNPSWSYAENQFKQFIVGGVKKSAVLDWAADTFVGDAYDRALKDYEGYKTWDRDMQESINKHIRAMTGAVMNQTEIPRYLREMATKTDDAVAYRAKIDATLKSLARATDLYNRMLDEGKVNTEQAQKIVADILEGELAQIVGSSDTEQPDWVQAVE